MLTAQGFSSSFSQQRKSRTEPDPLPHSNSGATRARVGRGGKTGRVKYLAGQPHSRQTKPGTGDGNAGTGVDVGAVDGTALGGCRP